MTPSPTGVLAIAEALETNTSLRVLNLARNHITMQGGDRLVQALKQNETVTLVDLSGNELGVEQLRQVRHFRRRPKPYTSQKVFTLQSARRIQFPKRTRVVTRRSVK